MTTVSEGWKGSLESKRYPSIFISVARESRVQCCAVHHKKGMVEQADHTTSRAFCHHPWCLSTMAGASAPEMLTSSRLPSPAPVDAREMPQNCTTVRMRTCGCQHNLGGIPTATFPAVPFLGVIVKPIALGSFMLGYSSSLFVNRRRIESIATSKKLLPLLRSFGLPSCVLRAVLRVMKPPNPGCTGNAAD